MESLYTQEHEEGCTFLGTYENYDLYWAQDCVEPTVIARWGSKGHEYMSGMCFGWIEDNPGSPLVEARKRAEARGLDVCRDHYAGKMRRHPSGIYYTVSEEAYANEILGGGEPDA